MRAPTLLRPGARTGGSLLALLAIVAAVGLAAGTPRASAGDGTRPTEPRPAAWRWTSEMLDVAARIPVQHGGRVKPLVTYAGYTLLGLDHRRSTTDADGEALPALAWLLEVVFRPERARRSPCFLVETDEVLDAIGLVHEGKKKRDHYTYEELVPARATLSALALQYLRLESTHRSAVEEGIVALDRAMRTFEQLASLLDFARAELDPSGAPAVEALFPGRARIGVLDVIARSGDLVRLAGRDDPHALVGAPREDTGSPAVRVAGALRRRVVALAEGSVGLALLPPPGTRSQDATWYAPGHALLAAQGGGGVPAGWGAQLERLVAAQGAQVRGDAPPSSTGSGRSRPRRHRPHGSAASTTRSRSRCSSSASTRSTGASTSICSRSSSSRSGGSSRAGGSAGPPGPSSSGCWPST